MGRLLKDIQDLSTIGGNMKIFPEGHINRIKVWLEIRM